MTISVVGTPTAAAKARTGPGAGLAPKPEIVSCDERQDVVDAQLAHMSTRGSLGIIGDQAKLIATAGEFAHNGLGIVDGREVGCRRFAQKSVDLPKKCRIGRPSQQHRPARRKDARRLIDQRRVGPKVRAVDKAALCGKLAVKGGVPACQMSQDDLNRGSPGAIEIDECAVLIEQDCTNSQAIPCVHAL